MKAIKPPRSKYQEGKQPTSGRTVLAQEQTSINWPQINTVCKLEDQVSNDQRTEVTEHPSNQITGDKTLTEFKTNVCKFTKEII